MLRPAATVLAVALALLPVAGPGHAQADGGGPYFYRALPYGTQSLIHPLRLVLNGGYGILQLDNRSGDIFGIDYAQGWRNTWRNLLDPGYAVSDAGWGDFLKREVVPFSFNSGKAQYWPNYTQHLIGGGMSYRMMAEWFGYHQYARPKLWAGGTIFAYHLLNEVVEASSREGPNTDPVADLLLFDPLSILLFSHDGVARFFSRTLNMEDWSYQPGLDPSTGELYNNGQNFSLRWRLPGTERWSALYHFGTHGEAGLSYRFDDEHSLGLALGLKAKELIELDRNVSTVDLGLSGGLFLDRNGSLLASLLMASTKDYQGRLNVYPGLLPLGRISPGFFVAFDRDDDWVTGITLDFLPHLPLGLAGAWRGQPTGAP